MVSGPASFGVAAAGETVYIRVNGDGVAGTCPTLRAFINRMLGTRRRSYVVDLKNCHYVDSCFMGTLVEIVLEQRGQVVVINASPKIYERFHLLGLTELLPVKQGAVKPPEGISLHRLRVGTASKKQLARAVEQAHRQLIAADERNRARFEPLLRLLRRELKEP